MLDKTGTVAGAIPGVLNAIVFEGTAEVGVIGMRSPTTESKVLTASCGCKTVRDGSKTAA